jgi:hypothetical protein
LLSGLPALLLPHTTAARRCKAKVTCCTHQGLHCHVRLFALSGGARCFALGHIVEERCERTTHEVRHVLPRYLISPLRGVSEPYTL